MTQPIFAHAPSIWPVDAPRALLIGRVWVPGTGPVVVRVQQEAIAEVVLQGLVETAHHLQFRVHQ